MLRLLAAVSTVCAFLVAGCGGGGGGGDSSPAALTFSPSPLTANITAATSATLTVRATATDPSVFSGTLYVYIVDSQQVLSGSVELAQVNSSTFSATLHTSAALSVGRHQGTFQIQLCRDAQCASQYAGSPVPLPYDLTVTPGPLTATPGSSTSVSLHAGGAAPADVAVSVAGPNANWTAITAVSWLKVTAGSGTGSGSFSVSFLPQGLAVGTYADNVTVRSADGQTATVPFSLTVLATQFAINSGVPTFTAVNGADIPAQTLSFALDNDMPSSWSATSSAAWLIAGPLSGTTPAVMTVKPDPSVASLASGTYAGNLALASPGIASKTITTSLTLVKPTLSVPSSTVTLGGSKGRDLASAQSLMLSLNTGSKAWPWTLSGLPAWLSSSAVSGTVAQTGTALALSPNVAQVAAGSTTATVTVTASVNGDSVALPLTVNLNADQRRLLASEWGVAFASTPIGAVASRTLTISDNFGGTLAWTASSDAAWLSVTGSGDTSGSASLVLNADASTLPSGAVSYANLTVSPTTTGAQPAVIRVALWKDMTSSTAITKLPLNYTNLVADKIRPYVYANNGGTAIDVFNAYTAQKIGTIANAAAALGQMSVSPDGGRLFALDTAARAMAVIDLATMAKTATWALDKAVSAATGLVAIRPNGVEVVLLGDGTAYTAARSLGVGLPGVGVSSVLAASADGRNVFALGARYGVDYSEMAGGTLFVNFLNGLNSNSGGNLRELAVNKEGTRAYEASGGGVQSGGYKCAVMDAVTGSYIGALPGGDAYPNNVAVTLDGRPICGISGWYATFDFWVHTPAGALLQGYKVAGYARALKDGQMVVTPDGLVVVALTDDPLIAFVPIGP